MPWLHMKDFFNKTTASYGVMCVTLIELPFKMGNCDKHYLQAFRLLSKNLIESSVYVGPVPVSSKMTEL